MSTMITKSNPQLDIAFEFVTKTNQSVFLTGKAGTGKTTFLQRVKSHTGKRVTIVAPTGVAAINAGGVTIHSLFQIPFNPYIPNTDSNANSFNPAVEIRRFSKEKINLIKSIDLLVIDEISMVRCDLLDAVDSVLRQFRNRSKPFGGVQLLLIGDINQLAPVVKDDEWQLLRDYYETVFFFSSRALKLNFPVIVELQHIFRQTDTTFIDILNKVRNNALDSESLQLLNNRLNRTIFDHNQDDGYITLTTHNATAKQINRDKLEKLPETSFFFQAKITGEFSEYAFPTDENLELKNGAQVMFIKNDGAKEKRYFNGKIGRITKISQDSITVSTEDIDEIEVGIEEWTNIKYTLNSETKLIEENNIGSFKQFPLKLAYAITIHKSQGLTFDKVIVDAQAAFSSGQVYVALSRCRTLEGIILSTPISAQSIKSDTKIDQFNTRISNEVLDEAKLEKAKFNYQESLLMDLLDYEHLRRPLHYLHKLVFENSPPIHIKSHEFLSEIVKRSDKEIGSIMRNFQNQIKLLLTDEILPENHEFLIERLKKGSVYFAQKISEILVPLQLFTVDTDNKTIKDTIHRTSENLGKSIAIYHHCFMFCAKGFDAVGFAQTRVNAEIDYDKGRSQRTKPDKIIVPKNAVHPELYIALRETRNNLAQEQGVEEYKIFPQKSLIGIVNALPTDFKTLESIKGIGKATSNKYGMIVLEIVQQYCDKNNIIPTPLENVNVIKEIGESARLSYKMFLLNPSVSDIAKERGLVESTINGHLSPYLEDGLLSIERFLSQEKIDYLTEFYTKNAEIGNSEAKELLGENYSFTDLRFFRSYWKWKLKETDS
jgi:hypothetical protein